MAAAPHGPIEVAKFPVYVQERRKKRILLKGEFLMIKRSAEEHATEFATRQSNVEKNCYPETLPYDYNRVILKPLPGIPDSHYINASYIDSFYQPKAYIVSQSMKTRPACVDFWRLVWEQQSNCVVMLTKVFDFMKVMCLQYFPAHCTQVAYDNFLVETVEATHYCYFSVRTVTLKNTNAPSEPPRTVKHFHFIEWELNGFPYISALIEFRRRVKTFTEQNSSRGPVIVHCSDGGERSGVYLAIDANLDLAQEENLVDVYGYCKMLANSRMNMVGDLDHYVFIYDILLEFIQCKVQPFSIHELQQRVTKFMNKKDRETMENEYAREYKLLQMLTPPLRIGDCAGGHRLENRGKNRDVMVVPPDYARPYLSTLHGESKDYTYINAVHVDGFFKKHEYIITEWPKTATVDSFWTMIFDHNCHMVINLSNQPNSIKNYPRFIHDKGKANYGPFCVEVTEYNAYPYMTAHVVRVTKRRKEAADPPVHRRLINDAKKKLNLAMNGGTEPSADPRTLAQTFMLTEIMMTDHAHDQEVRICMIFSIRIWPVQLKVPFSTSGFIDLIQQARSWEARSQDKREHKPTIVLSHNGVSRCGIYVAAQIVIDQMEIDHEIDIFHAVKMVRINRPQLVDNKEEYKYLYDLILHFYMCTPEFVELMRAQVQNGQAHLNGQAIENNPNHESKATPS